MLLSSLLESHRGCRFAQRHAPEDFVKFFFETGDNTPQGLEVLGRPKPGVAARGKNYRVVGYLVPKP